MKKLLALALALLSLTLSACASQPLHQSHPSDPAGSRRTSDFCLVLDPFFGFGRCETVEVTCYVLAGAQLPCWPKAQQPSPVVNPAPAPAPAPAPVAVLTAPAPAKKK